MVAGVPVVPAFAVGVGTGTGSGFGVGLGSSPWASPSSLPESPFSMSLSRSRP